MNIYIYTLRLTQLYKILLLINYWLLVPTSGAIIRPIFTKKLKMLLLIVQKHKFLWGPI